MWYEANYFCKEINRSNKQMTTNMLAKKVVRYVFMPFCLSDSFPDGSELLQEKPKTYFLSDFLIFEKNFKKFVMWVFFQVNCESIHLRY